MQSSDGTAHFEGYQSGKLLFKEGAAVYTNCVMSVKGGKHVDLVRKMLRDCIDLGIPPMLGGKHSTVLLDGGFCSVDVMPAVNDAEFAFIMPAVKNAKIKAAIKEHAQGQRTAVLLLTIKSNEGRKLTFRLIITGNPKKPKSDSIFDRYHVFAATLKCKSCNELQEYAPREYRKRLDRDMMLLRRELQTKDNSPESLRAPCAVLHAARNLQCLDGNQKLVQTKGAANHAKGTAGLCVH